jgi:LysM repeat protein
MFASHESVSHEKASVLGLILAVVVGVGAADYEVSQGDTLSEIAARTGVRAQDIVEANGLDAPNVIVKGDVLTIPGEDGAADSTYVVVAGDTLSELARDFGVATQALAEANGISDPDLILAGALLTVGVSDGDGGESLVVHTVEPGETLSDVARRYGTSVAAIADANDITDVDRVISGSALRIGAASPAPEPEPATTTTTTPAPTTTTTAPAPTHTVADGESLASIAGLYGTSAATLAGLNEIDDPNRIVVGDVLELPGAPENSGDEAPPEPGPAQDGMLCPVPGATFVDDFGVEKPDGRYHQGIDLFAGRGTSVVAPVPGEVEAVNGDLGGLQYWLNGDDGNLYIGTHLDGFGKVGSVAAGEVIGIVGDTGNALGAPPHLHFEILVDGNPINPYERLRGAC